MTTVPGAVEAVADVITTVLDQFGGWLAALDAALDGLVSVVSWGLGVVPQPLMTAIVGLAAWRGHRLLRASVTVVGLHLVALVGVWSLLIDLVAFGLVVGLLGVSLAFAGRLVSRKAREPVGLDRTSWLPGATIAVGLAFGLQAVIVAAGARSWTLAGVALASALAVPQAAVVRDEAVWQAARRIILVGVATALIVELLAGEGLGALLALAVRTGDVAPALQASLALVGLGAAITAALGRHHEVDRPHASADEVSTVEVNP